MICEEIWKPIKEYEGYYEVSNRGRVRGLDRILSNNYRWPGRIMKFKTNRYGYYSICLHKNGIKDERRVHRLVMEAFVGPLPVKGHTRHLDGNKLNNCLENLAYGDARSNHADMIAHGTSPKGDRHPGKKLSTEDVLFILKSLENGAVGRLLAKSFGVSPATISLIKNRKNWSHLSTNLAIYGEMQM